MRWEGTHLLRINNSQQGGNLMENSQRSIYVVDTNILIDYYKAFIPNGDNFIARNPTVDVSRAHVIIPKTVVNELSKIKKKDKPTSSRRKAAIEILWRLRALFANKGLDHESVYALQKPLVLTNGPAKLSILPVDKKIAKTIPYQPTEDDGGDGQIILTTLIAMQLAKDSKVTFLTNDNECATNASLEGITTSRYGYRIPNPYTGRRNLEVPYDLYHIWAKGKGIPVETWEKFMPEEAKLEPFEFIIMDPKKDGWQEHIPQFKNIGYYNAKTKTITPLKHYSKFPTTPMNDGQAIYAEALYHPDITAVVVSGPAGTGKTYMATVFGLDACRTRRDYMGIYVIPCYVKDRLGTLPGDQGEKMNPLLAPFKTSIQQFLKLKDPEVQEKMSQFKRREDSPETNGKDKKPEKSVLNYLIKRSDEIWENWFKEIHIDHARGRHFSDAIAIYDEFQDQEFREADILITRIGEGGKMIISGSVEQVSADYADSESNGLTYIREELKGLSGVAQVTFTEDEVVRSTLVKEYVKKKKAAREAAENHYQSA